MVADQMSASVYQLQQNDAELLLEFNFPKALPTSKIACVIKPNALKVSIDGCTKFDDELIGKVDVDESCWQVERDKKDPDNSKLLQVTLVKQSVGKSWKCVGKKEADELRTTAASSLGSGASDLRLMSVNALNPDDDEENALKNENDEKILEAAFLDLRKKEGLKSEKTLDKFFELFDNSIQLYRLNMLAKYLEEIVPVCRNHPNSKYKLKGIQAYAFVLWKKNQFREALPLFLEMEDILGRNGALCENIAHTYNSLGNYDKAEEYFSAALKFCQNDESATSQKGGTLLGLGLVRDRQGKTAEAEKIVRQSYEFYKRRSGGQLFSLQAKAGVALAKIVAQMGRDEEAEKLLKEATSCYEITCGEYSPLTCSGTSDQSSAPAATSKTTNAKRLEARKNLRRAYEIAIRKDAIDIIQLMDVHNGIVETITHQTDAIDRSEFVEFKAVVREGVKRLKSDPNIKQDGNAGVYYKLAGEFFCWCGYPMDAYEEGKELLVHAKGLFEVEKSCDCAKLIRQCTEMIGFAERVLAGEQKNVTTIPVSEEDKGRIAQELEQEERAREAAGKAGAGKK
eukprot:g4535.t1